MSHTRRRHLSTVRKKKRKLAARKFFVSIAKDEPMPKNLVGLQCELIRSLKETELAQEIARLRNYHIP